MCDVKKFKMHIQPYIKRRLYFLLLEYGKKKDSKIHGKTTGSNYT